MTKVSVIIPVFNQGAYLKECLRSFCNQSFQDLEILCVDDGSMDDSFEIAESIAKTDSRVRLVRRREPVDPETLENPSDAWRLVNLGRCANEALDRASGEYVMFPEADCYLRRNAVETMYRAACENGTDILLADLFSFSDDLDLRNRGSGDRTIRRVRLSEKAEDYGNMFNLKDRPELLSLGRYPQAAIFRKAFLTEKQIGFGGIAPGKFRYTGFFIRSMVAAERIMAVDTPVYLHREIPAARVRSMWEACSLNREFDEAYADLMQDAACREILRPYFWAEKARVYPAHLLKLRTGLQSRYAAYIAAELDRARDRGYLTQEACGSEVFSDLQILMKSPEDYLTVKTVDVKDYAMHMRRSESYRIGAAAVKVRNTAGKIFNKGKDRIRRISSRLGRSAGGDNI